MQAARRATTRRRSRSRPRLRRSRQPERRRGGRPGGRHRIHGSARLKHLPCPHRRTARPRSAPGWCRVVIRAGQSRREGASCRAALRGTQHPGAPRGPRRGGKSRTRIRCAGPRRLSEGVLWAGRDGDGVLAIGHLRRQGREAWSRELIRGVTGQPPALADASRHPRRPVVPMRPGETGQRDPGHRVTRRWSRYSPRWLPRPRRSLRQEGRHCGGYCIRDIRGRGGYRAGVVKHDHSRRVATSGPPCQPPGPASRGPARVRRATLRARYSPGWSRPSAARCFGPRVLEPKQLRSMSYIIAP